MTIPPQILVALGITGGGIAGFGLYLLVMQFVPATPALGPALRRLHPAPPPDGHAVRPANVKSRDNRWNIQLPKADLDILGRTGDKHIFDVVVSALVSMVIPPSLSVVAAVVGYPLPVTVPVAATLAVALLVGFLVHASMRSRAKAARAEFVRALCTYTALTAHQVRSGHGAVEAMERAARVCEGWPYVRLRHALLTAQLQMTTPWEELKKLSDAIGVVELSTFADIMHSAGTDGAQVYQTLRAQASSLRDQIRVRSMEVTKTRSSKLDIPSTLLVIVLLVLVGYPLMISILQRTS
ncbi:MAG TPA: type II secretion system F family protein [Candidatus Limnocylindrales bacterium]|nr:type II secretion system F family protein [Candidatus Limnocylindrales bacterium]